MKTWPEIQEMVRQDERDYMEAFRRVGSGRADCPYIGGWPIFYWFDKQYEHPSTKIYRHNP